MNSNQKGFTLAEMMIVLLIMSIVTAAFLPVITKKNKITTELWSLAANNSDIYSQLGATQSVMIGKSSNDNNTKLLINSVASMPDQIGFEEDGTYTGRIKMDSSSNLHFGNTSDNSGYNNTISIGTAASAQDNYSVAIGSPAKTESSTGAVAVGYDAYAYGNAVAIGSMAQTDTNANGVAIGSGARSYNGSISIGTSAMFSGVSGIMGDNIAIGNSALFSASGGQGNIGIGSSTLRSVSGDYNTAVGYTALYTNNTGHSNTGIGRRALYYNTTGYNNTAIGQEAMLNNINGSQNTSIGVASLNSHTTGDNNTAIGVQALFKNTSGDHNTAIGRDALLNNTTGTWNTALGPGACSNVTGSNKICIGPYSGPDASSAYATDNSERIFIGGKSKFNGGAAVLEVHNTGNYVTVHSGIYHGSDSTVVINGNLIVKGTIMSHIIDRYGNNVSDFRYLERYGEDENNASLKGSISDNTGFDQYFTIGTGWVSSDRRLKNVGAFNNDGLDKIRQLKVYNYTFKKDKKKVPQVGVIAQDLQKIFPNAVTKDKRGYLMIRHDDMFYAVINAIKELDKTMQYISIKVRYIVRDLHNIHTQIYVLQDNDAQNAKKIDDLYKKYNEVNNKFLQVKKENHALTAEIKKLKAKKH